MMDPLTDEAVLNSAAALGVEADSAALLQFARDMQASALLGFSKWCRESGSPIDRVSWVDVAINAELSAAELGPVTVSL